MHIKKVKIVEEDMKAHVFDIVKACNIFNEEIANLKTQLEAT